MKLKTVIFIAALMISSIVNAQERKFRFELGLEYPAVTQSGSYAENLLGYYVRGRYKIGESDLAANLRLSYGRFTRTLTEDDNFTYGVVYFTALPYVDWKLFDFDKVKIYGLLGAGVSIDQDKLGYDNPTNCHFIATPGFEALLFDHVNVSLMYYATKKEYQRLMLSLGYRF